MAPISKRRQQAYRCTVVAVALLVYVKVLQRMLPADDEEASNVSLSSSALMRRMLPLCRSNPYTASIQETLEEVASRATTWLEQIDVHRQRAAADPVLARKESKHARFFPFVEMASCTSRECIGGQCGHDESKIGCGIEKDLNKEGCVVYSVGSNNQWTFERDLLRRTPCEIYTFDCTGRAERFHRKPHSEKLHFHHVCLGTENRPAPERCVGLGMCGETWTLLEMQRRLGHERIDLLKMDAEGFEWPLFESWPELWRREESERMILPMQVMVEVHYHTLFPELLELYNHTTTTTTDDDIQNYGYFRSPQDIVSFQEHLLRMGYVVLFRDDNRVCPHCTELTLLRISCPDTGVYAARGGLKKGWWKLASM